MIYVRCRGGRAEPNQSNSPGQWPAAISYFLLWKLIFSCRL